MELGYDPREACFGGDVPLPAQRKKFYRISSPKPGQEVEALITSSEVLISYTHFQQEQTFACTRCPSSCPFCKAGVQPRMKGYVCGVDPTSGKAIIVELTANTLYAVPRLCDRTQSLRGLFIRLFRRGKAKNSPVTAVLDANSHPGVRRNLPEPFDLKRALLDMWAIPTEIVNVATGDVQPVEVGELFGPSSPGAYPS